MTAAIVPDLEQTVFDRQRAARLMTAVRSIPQPRTDVPLVPVPFAERMASPLWDSLVQKPRCLTCMQVKPLDGFTQSEKELKRNPMLRYKAYRKCDECREGTR